MNKELFFDDYYYLVTLVIPIGAFINFLYDLSKNINKLCVLETAFLVVLLLAFISFVYYLLKALSSLKYQRTLVDGEIDFLEISLLSKTTFSNDLYVSQISIICYFLFSSFYHFWIGDDINNTLVGYSFWIILLIVLSSVLIYPSRYLTNKKDNISDIEQIYNLDSNISSNRYNN